MKHRGGFEEYQAFMADWMAEALTLNGKLTHADDRLPEDLKLIDDIFKRFTEVTETIDNLDLCLQFIAGRTPSRKGLKLDSYLIYHITFYIQEIYILNERLESYATVVQRRRKKLGEAPDPSKYEVLIALVRKTLEQIVKVRGAHVHDRAFSDQSMKDLGTFSFLANHDPKDTRWAVLARNEYAKSKKFWVEQLRKNKLELKRLLDEYFKFIYSEISESAMAVPPKSSFKPNPLHGST